MVLLILKRMISAATTVTAFTFQYGSINTLTLRNWCTTLFHLHSSMVLLILWKRQLMIIILIYLHSSMVLLIQTTGRIVKQRDWHLHSSIVLLILSTNVPSGYSYFIFTFQYSSINTPSSANSFLISIILPLSVDLVISYFFGTHNLLLWSIKSPVFP